MKTIDLRKHPLTIQELLRMAQSDSLLLVSDDEQGYTLEVAGDFEKEALRLGQSERFVEFLKGRSQEPGRISLEDVETNLDG